MENNNKFDSNFLKEDFLVLIKKIDKEDFCGGLVPFHLFFKTVITKFNLKIVEIQQLLIQLERSSLVYLEPINDPNRLDPGHRMFAINDPIRGLLYYIGSWN